MDTFCKYVLHVVPYQTLKVLPYKPNVLACTLMRFLLALLLLQLLLLMPLLVKSRGCLLSGSRLN